MFAMFSGSSLRLKEGEYTSLPAPLTTPAHMEYIPSKKSLTKGVTINLFSEYYAMELSLVVQGFRKEGGGFEKKTFVSRNLVSNVFTVTGAQLSLFNDPVVTITVKNTEGLTGPLAKLEYDPMREITFTIITDITQLPENSHIEMKHVRQGSFRYFTYRKKQSVKGIITLNVLIGEADLYISKGGEKYPDLVNYDYRSNTYKDDEIMLEANPPAAGATDKTEVFIVGVYCTGNNLLGNGFEIKAVTNTDFTLYKVVPGRAIRKYIHPGERIVLSYYNPHEEDFEIAVAGEKGPLEVRFTQYDEAALPDFMAKINNLDQPYRVVTTGYLSRQNISPVKGAFKRQYLISVKPESAGDQVVVLVGPPQQAIVLEGNNDFRDTVTDKGCRTYRIETGQNVYGQELLIALSTGNIKVTINEDSDLSKESESRQVFSLQTGLGQAEKRTVVKGKENFMLGFYMEICSFAPSSKVKIHVPQAAVRYTRLVPGERVKHRFDKEGLQRQYYYSTNTSEVTSIAVVFELDKIGGTYFKDFKDRVTRLHEIEKRLAFNYITDKEFGFKQGTNEAAPKLIAANLIRSKEYSNDLYNYARLDFQVQTGEFVISSVPSGNSETNDYVQFQLIVDDYQMISPSGVTTLEVRKGKSYSLLVHKDDPRAQHNLRVDLTSCVGSATVEFYDADNNNRLIMTKAVNDEISLPFMSSNSSTVREVFTQNTILMKVTTGSLRGMITPDDVTVLNINTEVISSLNHLGIQEYFHAGIDQKQWNLEVTKGERDFSVSLDAVQPSEGFHERYPKFQFATLQYTVFVNPSSLGNTLNKNNNCRIERNLNAAKVVKDVTRVIKKVEQGQLEFPVGRVAIDQVMYPMDVPPPYSGWVQIAINLEGNFSDGQDDDSVVIIKLPFNIEEDALLQPRVRLGLVVLLLCAIVILVTVMARRMLKALGNIQTVVERNEHRGRAGFEMAGLQLEGDNGAPNKIEAADESQELANASNETHTI